MLIVAPNLSSFALAAGEPFLFQVQFLDADGEVVDTSARAFVLSIYKSSGRQTAESIPGEQFTDAGGAYLDFSRDGGLSETLFSQGQLSVELAERYKNGRNVIATGGLKIAPSAAGVASFDNGPIGAVVVRATIQASDELGGPLTFGQELLAYEDAGDAPPEAGQLDFSNPANSGLL